MGDSEIVYGFEHWMELRELGENVRDNMVTVPEGEVIVCGKTFRVGEFKISKNPVTESEWDLVMGAGGVNSAAPAIVPGVEQIGKFRQRILPSWQGPGRLSIPTEAQLKRAMSLGLLQSGQKDWELCINQFREEGPVAGHHFLDNLPRENENYLPVIIKGDERSGFREKDATFRLVIIDEKDVLPDEELKDMMRQMEL